MVLWQVKRAHFPVPSNHHISCSHYTEKRTYCRHRKSHFIQSQSISKTNSAWWCIFRTEGNVVVFRNQTALTQKVKTRRFEPLTLTWPPGEAQHFLVICRHVRHCRSPIQPCRRLLVVHSVGVSRRCDNERLVKNYVLSTMSTGFICCKS